MQGLRRCNTKDTNDEKQSIKAFIRADRTSSTDGAPVVLSRS